MQSTKKLIALSLVFLLLQSINAFATFLFVGQEDTDFYFYGTSVVDTGSTGQRRTSWSRMSINAGNGGCDPACNRVSTATFTASSSIWVHAVLGAVTDLQTTSGNHALCIYGADGVCRFLVRGSGSYSTLKLSKRNAAGTYTDLQTCSSGLPLISATKFDLFLNYSSTGQAILYANGVALCNYSGDVTTDGQTQVNQIYFSSANNPSFAGPYFWSEIIVATTDTRDMNLFTCIPTANGTTQSWTGAATDIDEATIADGDSISTTSTGTVGNFTCQSAPPAGSYTVPAIVQSARVQGYPGTITNFRFNARPAGASADYDTSADIPVIGVFQNYPNNIVTTNPDTSSAWTTSNLGSGVNFGVKSRP